MNVMWILGAIVLVVAGVALALLIVKGGTGNDDLDLPGTEPRD